MITKMAKELGVRGPGAEPPRAPVYGLPQLQRWVLQAAAPTVHATLAR